jgi:SAM-dependent methyltransferase
MLKSNLRKFAKTLSRKEIYEELRSFTQSIPRNSRILNIGSGGEIEKLIKDNCLTDISIISMDIDINRNPDIVADISAEFTEEEVYDYIICSEVLEHVVDPFKAVENIRQLVKTGGEVFVSTPYQFPTHDAPFDHFRYTEFGLRMLLNSFSDLKLEVRGSWLSTITLLVLRGLWLGDRKINYMVYLIFIWNIPMYLTLKILADRQIAHFCTGFICTFKK